MSSCIKSKLNFFIQYSFMETNTKYIISTFIYLSENILLYWGLQEYFAHYCMFLNNSSAKALNCHISVAKCMWIVWLNRKLYVNYVNLANLSLPSPHMAVCDRFPWASSSLPLVAPGVKMCRLQGSYASWKPLNFSNPISRPWKYLNFVNINLSPWKFLNSHWMNNSTLKSLKCPLK